MKNIEIHIVSATKFKKILESNKLNNNTIKDKKNLFFISIIGDGDDDGLVHVLDTAENVLNLEFDDVEEDCLVPVFQNDGTITQSQLRTFTEKQGKKVIEFLDKIKESKEENITLLLHCFAGISRSGAIGTFAHDYLETDKHSFIMTNPQIRPNSNVLRVLNRLMYDRSE